MIEPALVSVVPARIRMLSTPSATLLASPSMAKFPSVVLMSEFIVAPSPACVGTYHNSEHVLVATLVERLLKYEPSPGAEENVQ